MSPNAGGPSSDDPAPKATARQILRVMRHRSLSVRKGADMPAQLSSWPTQQLRMEPTPEPLRVLLQHMRPKVKPVRSIEKFCGILMTLLDRSGGKSPRLAATQILNRSRNNSQCQALLWPNVSIVLSAWCRQVHIRLSRGASSAVAPSSWSARLVTNVGSSAMGPAPGPPVGVCGPMPRATRCTQSHR